MRFLFQSTAAVWLVISFPAQVVGQDHGEEPAGAVVLVVKILSGTHARLATGVVLARSHESHAALVVLSADFVSRGDEILVLDGGTDLLRNGRPSRTVARSAETGVAVLEVDGLSRTGVELAQGTTSGRLLYLAWPAAQKLVSGVAMLRASVELAVSDGGVATVTGLESPAQAGPLLDSCGGLAGFVTGGAKGSAPHVATGRAIAELLESASLEFVAGVCGAGPAGQESPAEAGNVSVSEEAPANPPRSQSGKESKAAVDSTTGELAIEHEKSGGAANAVTWAAVLGVGFAGLYLWLRRRPPGLRLERETTQNTGSGDRVSVKARGGSALIRCGGTTVRLSTEGDRVVISHRITGDGSVAVALADTPCLEGEEFLASEGDRLSVGGTGFRIRLGKTR